MCIPTNNNESLLKELELAKKHIAELEAKNIEFQETIKTFNEQEAVFNEVIREAPAGLGLLVDRVFVKVNRLVCEITGYEREELVGASSSLLYLSEKEFTEAGKRLKEQIEKNGTFSYEAVWRRKDGRLIDVKISKTPRNRQDISQGVIFTVLDITSEKKAKLALQSSEERLKVIFEHAPDAIFLVNFKGEVLDGNKASEHLLGYGKTELLGKSLLTQDIMDAGCVERIGDVLKQNEKGHSSGPVQLRVRTKSKQSRDVELSTYPIVINKKKIVLGVARDITQKLKEEELLRANEQRMAFHVNQTPLAVIEWDLNFKVRSWNPAAESIFGYTEEEALGQHATFIIPDAGMQDIDKVWTQLTTDNGGGRSSNTNRHKNGDLLDCEWYNTPLVNDHGDVIAVASLALDSTERVRSEKIQKVVYNISKAVNANDNLHKLIGQIQENLSSIIDTTNFFIALYDKENDTLSLPFFADELDRFSSFPAGKTLTGYVIRNNKALLVNKAEIAKLEEQGEVDSVGSDCEIWLGVPLVTDRVVIGALVVQSYNDPHAYDLEDLKMLKFVSNQISLSIHKKNRELELVDALKRAKESDKLKSAFLANMSHEIRTPMNGILGFANLLKNDGLSDEESSKYIAIIEKSGNRMLGVINDLIDISKIESGMTEVQISDFNLNGALEYVYSFFKPEAELKGLELSYFTGLKEEDSVIEADREKLYAILINLVKNAIKYTNSGEIKFGYERINNVLRFKVQDTGIGIEKNKQDSIFSRFVQADYSLTRSYDGVGLGLAITKAYVSLMEGKIWVESEFGKGSVFYVEIPYLAGEKAEKINETKKIMENTQSKRKLNILVAEDDLINQKLFSYILKEIANELVITINGREAVETFSKRDDFDLVLMDLKMPEMDGYEATQKIRECSSEVKIIALSAFALETERKKALDSGFNNYVSKPISRGELMEAIGNYFDI